MNFTVFGCKIKIDFLFVLLLSLSALFSAYSILYLLLFSFLHEMGHLLALYIFGGKADSLIFSYYGAALKYQSKLPRAKEFIVLLCGPIVNLIFYLLIRDDINLVLFILNMLPIYPLDAGRIINLYSFNLSKKLGFVFLFLISIFAVYLLIVYKSFSMLLIVVYLIIYSINY
ncbi:MAG: hypothetical protein NC213_06700 [Acetobacter sp.]|nr:hypothetical protein [Bacteroides sp.]MCM1341415.1 hypothetical protein [Acetobacter sp.]MCM1433369.1 hypothetical protein [Clostridiales bacterium]